MPRIDKLQMARQRVHQQRQYIESCGGSLNGYFQRYGSSHPEEWKEIYRADRAELQKRIEEVEALERRVR